MTPSLAMTPLAALGKRSLLASLSLSLSLAIGTGTTLGAQRAPDSAMLRALTEARVAADFRADRTALDSLLAPELTYVRSSGVLDSKAAVLAQVGPGGPYQLDYLTPDSLQGRLHGGVGIVNGILHVKLSAQPAPYRIRFTDVWADRNGRWQLIAFHATRLP